MEDKPERDTNIAEMAPSMNEAIEEQPKNQEKAGESAANTTPEASESSKKKKKKKKDSPKSGGADDKNEKENGKDTKESTGEKDTATTEKNGAEEKPDLNNGPVVSASKRTRPPYKFDSEKITLRFLFANRDGLTVTALCKPSDTIGEVKGQLLSVWPEDLQKCISGDQLRLICMGKGMLTPDTRTLQDCEVPVFKTHPTPVNVAVRPITNMADNSKSGKVASNRGGGSSGVSNNRVTEQSGQGCGCIIS